MNDASKTTTNNSQEADQDHSQAGKVKVKFFWKASLIISIILTVLGTIILNMIFNR